MTYMLTKDTAKNIKHRMKQGLSADYILLSLLFHALRLADSLGFRVCLTEGFWD
jgi:hypothetical protein